MRNSLFTKPKEEFRPSILMKIPTRYCCGCDLLEGFGGDHNETIVKKDYAYWEQRFNSQMIAILNGAQRKVYHDFLLEKNWIVIADRVRNRNSGNYLTTYMWRHDNKTAHGRTKKKSS